MEKTVIYSLLPRLWGNETKNPKPNGSYEENGCGKMEQITAEDLRYIRSLGCSHVWYIGLLSHATSTSFDGVAADPEPILKGRAGSPYAVRNYYDVAPSLACDVSRRMEEFEALIKRTHEAGLKVIIDFIPNHVARSYQSPTRPEGIPDLGQYDDRGVGFSNQNNFYYILGQSLHLPSAGSYEEVPARATGNDCFSAYPGVHDWYETIKLNYGVDYLHGSGANFCPIPSTWYRMLEILRFWMGKGVDGFRCDMAEMVPVEFWHWAIGYCRQDRSDILFLAEIYQPALYRPFLEAGFDMLYDKVGMYDTMRSIIRGELSASSFDEARSREEDILPHMCYFLENHDEERIASDFFARYASSAIPALGAMLLSGENPFLIYFGQEVGEKGMEVEGFSGLGGRTTIFDYWALSSIQRLRGEYKENGLSLREEERCLMKKYSALINLSQAEPIFSSGAYFGLNYAQAGEYNIHRLLSFARYKEDEVVLVVCNFSPHPEELLLTLPQHFLDLAGVLPSTTYAYEDLSSRDGGIMCLTSWAPIELCVSAHDVLVLRFNPIH